MAELIKSELKDGKQYKTYKLTKKEPKQFKNGKDAYIEICICVAKHFTQYTLDQVMNELPFKMVKEMYNYIQKERAETLLLVNAIINGPNEKSKTQKSYKKTIEHLVEVANK